MLLTSRVAAREVTCVELALLFCGRAVDCNGDRILTLAGPPWLWKEGEEAAKVPGWINEEGTKTLFLAAFGTL